MCDCRDKTCPKRQVWMTAVRLTAVQFFTTLTAALRERHRVHEAALCNSSCRPDCQSEHDTVDMDALNPYLDQFYRSLDAANIALTLGDPENADLTVHLLRSAFEQAGRRYWRTFRKACRQARDLMVVLRGAEFRVSSDKLTTTLRSIQASERLVVEALERYRSDTHLIAHAASAPIKHPSKRRGP